MVDKRLTAKPRNKARTKTVVVPPPPVTVEGSNVYVDTQPLADAINELANGMQTILRQLAVSNNLIRQLAEKETKVEVAAPVVEVAAPVVKYPARPNSFSVTAQDGDETIEMEIQANLPN